MNLIEQPDNKTIIREIYLCQSDDLLGKVYIDEDFIHIQPKAYCSCHKKLNIKMREVEVDNEGYCIHCGHYPIWSSYFPNYKCENTNTWIKLEGQ